MKTYLNFRNYNLLIILICFFSITYAFYIEYILGYPACILCKFQRIPYFFGILLSFLCIIIPFNKKVIIIFFIIFLFSFFLSLYHVSIEQGLINSIFNCTDDNLGVLEKDQILSKLKVISPDCKNVNFSIFGISLATINLILSFVILLITQYLYKNEKNR